MKKLLGRIQRTIASPPTTLGRAETVFSVVWRADRPGLEAVLGQHSEEAASELIPQLVINGTSLPPSRRQRRPDDGRLILVWEELPTMAREQEKILFSFASKIVKPASARVGAPRPGDAAMEPVAGHFEGFDHAGNICGWLDRSTRHPGEFSVVCGDERLPVHPEIQRQDLAEAGFPSGRGFIVEFREILPLLGPFFSGHALRIEGISGALVSQPLYWPVLQPARRNEILWNWLARFFALSLESSTFDLEALELFDAEFSKLEQEGLAGLQDEVGAMRCVQLMQDLCGQQVGGQADFRSNLAKLCQLSSRLARSHPLWKNAVAGFQAAMIAEDFLDTVRSVWKQQALLEAEDEKPVAPPAPLEALFLAPVLHAGRLHFLPWEGWVRNNLLRTIELAANLPAEKNGNEDLAAKLSAVEAVVSLLYRDEEIIGGLQRLRRQLGVYSGQPSAHARREVVALMKQRKFLQALSIESRIPSEESVSGAVNAFASQLGAARELGQTLPTAVIRAWKDRLGSGVEQAVTNPVFLAALHGYLEFAGQVLMNPATTAGQPIGQAQQMRLDIIGSIKELLSLEPIRPLARGSKAAGEPLNILLVGSRDLPQVHLYRQEQKVAALRNLSTRTRPINVERADTWEKINDPKLTRRLVGCDILVLCRLPATLSVLRLIHAARRAGVRVIYEVDDLIFDHENFPPAYETYSGSVTRREHRQLAEDTPLWLEAMRLADEIIVSTATLAERVRVLLGDNQPVHVEPNCQPGPLRSRGRVSRYLSHPTIRRWRATERMRLVYGTGTKAHKQIINQWILPVLEDLLERYPQLDITLVGRLKAIPHGLANHPRVQIVPFIGYDAYLDILSSADLTLAAIEEGVASDAKSGLKWMEAAFLGVPSVVSPSATYRELLEDGSDVLFAGTKEQWEEQLGRLISDPDLRTRIAEGALRKATASFSPTTAENVWSKIIRQEATDPQEAWPTGRPLRLLLVNLYFQPQSQGGATRVVEDQIRKLLDRYPGRYEITVLCADRFAHDGGTDIYWQESVRVVRFKTSSKEWHSYRDDESKKFMQDWLRRESFDVVHVHALQVLTASVLEAVAAASIPYIVSIHDAWWFSPHQFLTSPSGQPVDPQDWLAETGMRPPSPTSGGEVVSVAAQLRKLEKLLRLLHRNAQEQSEASARGDISQRGQLQAKRRELDVRLEDLITDQSIRIRVYSAYVRQRDLLGILHGATARLAVSSSFARLCAQAGAEEVEVLNNSWQIFSPGGVRPEAAPLECAFIGGWSLHKGAGILLEACQLLGEADQIRLRIVDHSLAADEYCVVKWGGIDVRFIAPIPMTGMQLFYSSIDVLIAPSIWPESFGLVTREALAAGVWVIAADSGALAEPVFDSINGQVIPPRDAQALADAIRWACTPEGRKVLQGWREDALAGIGSNKPPDNLETLHSLYKKAAGIS